MPSGGLMQLVELGLEPLFLAGYDPDSDPYSITTVLTGMRIPNIFGNGHSLTIDFNNLKSKTIENVKIEECSICLGKESNIITKCKHQFCKDCIDEWCNKNTKMNCPNCRAKLSKYKVFSIIKK